MKRSLIAFAFAIASTSAFGFQNQDYQFKVVVKTGQTIGGYTLSSLASPAINNLGNMIFSAYVHAPFGSSTYFAGLFSPEGLIVPANGFPACLGPYAINDAGQIAFVEDSKLSPTMVYVSGVYESNYIGGPVTTIAAPGSTVDGVQLLENICSNSAQANGGTFAFDHAGRIAFLDSGGFYKYTSEHGLKKIDTSKFDGQSSLSGLVIGQSDEILFQSSVGVFARDRALVRTPEHLDGVDITSVYSAVASRDAKLAVLGYIGPITADDAVLFTRDSVVAKSGQRIGDKVLTTAGFPFFGFPAVNNRGEIIFAASFGAGVYPADTAIFSPHAVIVSVGDSIDGGTIASLGVPALNDYGVIAFLATLTDGTQEIIEATPKWCR